MSKEITNIVFYKNTSKEKKEKPRACIFYTDQTYNNVDFHEGKKQVNEFLRSMEIYFNYFDYLNEKYIYYLEEEIFRDHLDSFLNNEQEQIEQLPKIKPKDPFWKKMGLVLTIIFLMVMIEFCNGLQKEEPQLDPDASASYLDQDLSNPNTAYQNILSQLPDEPIKSVFLKVKDFLYYYNTEYAESTTEEKIKPALTFNEVVLLNVILNDLSLSKIDMIYEGQTFTNQELKNMYLKAFNQIVLSHVIDTQGTFSLEKLIIDEKELKEYKKYHKMLTACRTKQGNEQEVEVNKFCTIIRENFLSNKKNNQQPPLSVIPIINAFEILFSNLNIDAFLTIEEINTINYNYLYKVSQEKFEYVNKSTRIISNHPNIYEGLKYIAEYDLSTKEAYYSNEEDRDLTLTSSFNNQIISELAYLEIMLENYKMFFDTEYKISQNLTQTASDNEEQNKVNTKKFDK